MPGSPLQFRSNSVWEHGESQETYLQCDRHGESKWWTDTYPLVASRPSGWNSWMEAMIHPCVTENKTHGWSCTKTNSNSICVSAQHKQSTLSLTSCGHITGKTINKSSFQCKFFFLRLREPREESNKQNRTERICTKAFFYYFLPRCGWNAVFLKWLRFYVFGREKCPEMCSWRAVYWLGSSGIKGLALIACVRKTSFP